MGGWFGLITLVTSMEIVSESVSEPSDTVKETICCPTWVELGIQVKVVPVNVAFAGRPDAM